MAYSITAQIISNRLQSLCQEMAVALQRTSRSPLLALDCAFATGIVTGDMRLAAQLQREPEHLYALRESTRHLFDYFAFDIADGDVLVVADPYASGTQAQVLTMVVPLFFEGDIVLFPAVRARMTDLAGEQPGGYHPEAFEIWQEGICISPLKLYQAGVLQQDVWRFLLNSSRASTLLAWDLRAMQVCCLAARRQLEYLFQAYGSDTVKQCVTQMIDHSRRRVQDHLQHIPATTRQGAATFSTNDNAPRCDIRVRVMREEDQVVFDFDGTSPQVRGPSNCTITATHAFAALPVLAPLLDDLLINDGVLDLFVVRAEAGTLVNPTRPAATSLSATVTGHMIAAAVTAALQSSDTDNALWQPIHGAGLQAIFFEPVGTQAEIQPIFLNPGYTLAHQGWGPPALFGERQIVSAEELEMTYQLRVLARETDAASGAGMTVRIENGHGMLHANILVPQGNAEQGRVVLSGSHSATIASAVANIALEQGDIITFVYAGQAPAGTSYEQ